MFKHKYTVAAVLLGLSVTASGIPVSAAGTNGGFQKIREGVYVYVGSMSGQMLPGCAAPGFPGSGQPGDGNQPEDENTKPDTNVPGQPGDGNQPEDENAKPDTNVPGQPGDENTKPDTNVPGQPGDGNRPGDGNQPEDENAKPDMNVPGQPGDENQPDGGTGEEDVTGDQAFAKRVAELVNQERAKEGLPALKYDAAIAKSAVVRAKETEISFSHTRPNGTSFSTALRENGISFMGAGENIAWGQKTPESVMQGWMNSPGHRANILNKNFTKIGVGYYQNSKGINYWTQLFTY